MNHALGTLSLLLHGCFSYPKLRKIHLAHHNAHHHAHPRAHHDDPDMPTSTTGPFLIMRWFATMATTYATPCQALCFAVHITICVYVLQVPLFHVMLFIVGPFVMSVVRLFFFLTYLPHNAHACETPCRAAHKRGTQSTTEQGHIKSFVGPKWFALWSSFFAVYHAQHHWWPWLPWWQLGHVATVHC